MEFDIGNILYLVITLVVVIVGLMGKKKKQAPKGSEPQNTSRPQGGFLEGLEKVLRMGQEDPAIMDLHDHEDDLYGEEELVYDEQPAESSPVATGADANFQEEYQQVLDRLSSRESEISLGNVDGKVDSLELIQLEDEEGADYFQITRDFDARTAVVYAAIINRVDY